MARDISGTELLIEPGAGGPLFVLSTVAPLTLVERLAGVSWWSRLSLAVGLSILVIAWPQFSRATSFTAAEITAATNSVRRNNSLPPLTVNIQLTRAAQDKAEAMFAQQYFDHTSPSRKTFWSFIEQSGYTYTTVGENLAIDFIDGRDVVPTWMSSASHRHNLLNPVFRDVGVAVVDGLIHNAATTVVVQFFGSRQSTAALPPTPPITKQVAKPATVQSVPTQPAQAVTVPPVVPVELPTNNPSVVSSMSVPAQGIQQVSPTMPFIPRPTYNSPGHDHNPQLASLIIYVFGYEIFLLSGIVFLRRLLSQAVTFPQAF